MSQHFVDASCVVEKEHMDGWIKASIATGVALLLVFLGYLFFLNHVDINEIGVAYNSIGGQVSIQRKPGWYVTPPTVRVATISTLPIKVEIPSQAAVINAKMVKFNPDGVDEFIRLQGFSYYTNQGMENILLGWAYSGHQMPFLDVIQDVGVENVTTKPLNQNQ